MFLLLVSHGLVGVIGFAAGIYLLPILIAPPAPTEAQLAAVKKGAVLSGRFERDLKGSDALHWGEGDVFITATSVSMAGAISPGPDYKLYFTPQFVQTEAEFEALRDQAVRVGDVKTFENFIVPVPPGIDPQRFDTVVVWCERFSEFITAARYR